ncbi:MAG: glycosyltransferase [Polaribacter sp.]|jgi:glycosyltransferase involved in cell wall biosynthesis
MTKKRIIFVLPSLKAGGAERVISSIAKRLDRNLFEIKLIVFGFEKDSIYELGDLDITFLKKNRVLNGIYPLYRLMKNEKPDIVFGSIRHINVLLGFYNLIFRNISFIVRESSVWSVMSKFSNSKVIIPYFLVNYLYNRMDGFVCQSNDIKNDLKVEFGINDSKLTVINNPITEIKRLPIKNNENTEIIKFITVGRLSEEKGHERILRGLVKVKNYSYSYTIIGSGHLELKIKALANELGIIDKINFITYSSKIIDYLSDSDFFIQGSYVEGFPNSVLESCSVGTPVIAFNCPGGTKEIICNGINGFLIHDQQHLVKTLENLKGSCFFKRDEVIKSVSDKFSLEKIIAQYQKLFLSNIKGS